MPRLVVVVPPCSFLKPSPSTPSPLSPPFMVSTVRSLPLVLAALLGEGYSVESLGPALHLRRAVAWALLPLASSHLGDSGVHSQGITWLTQT